MPVKLKNTQAFVWKFLCVVYKFLFIQHSFKRSEKITIIVSGARKEKKKKEKEKNQRHKTKDKNKKNVYPILRARLHYKNDERSQTTNDPL